MNKTLGGMSMKTLWKFAAALAAIHEDLAAVLHKAEG